MLKTIIYSLQQNRFSILSLFFFFLSFICKTDFDDTLATITRMFLLAWQGWFFLPNRSII